MSLLERIYYFHEQIELNRFPNTRALMEEFEISQATAYRDIAYLRDRLLAPLAFDRRRNGYYYTSAFQLPFEQSPLLAMILGLLDNLLNESGLGDMTGLPEIVSKLQQMVFPGSRGQLADLLYCEWIELEKVDPVVFGTTLSSLRQRCCLLIDYRDSRGERSQRVIEPLKLVNYQGRWYLLAWCRLRQGRRIFHLSRIEAIEQLAQEGVKRTEVSDQWLKASFGIFKGLPLYEALIEFTGKAKEIVRYQQWHREQHLQIDGDRLLLQLPVHDDRELIMKVLQFGSHAKVLSPEPLRRRLAEEVQRMQALY